MINELRAQPGFVDHFQIWVFESPTGQAFLSSAARLREQLATSRRVFDPLSSLVNESDEDVQEFEDLTRMARALGVGIGL